MAQHEDHPHQTAKNRDNGQAEHDVWSAPHEISHVYLHAVGAAVSGQRAKRPRGLRDGCGYIDRRTVRAMQRAAPPVRINRIARQMRKTGVC